MTSHGPCMPSDAAYQAFWGSSFRVACAVCALQYVFILLINLLVASCVCGLVSIMINLKSVGRA